jgi:predicted O-linked N-acetylglucosamine transferase (SPINDLY family)
MSLPDAIRQAVELHLGGRLAEAEGLYKAILTANPDHFDALHLLGVIRYQRGETAEALRLITAALAIKPDSAEALVNRGNALQALSRHEEALASYDRALATKPDYAEALNNRGNALQNLKRHGEALASYDRALAIKPDYAEALNNRGNALQDLKRHEEALRSYDRALAIKPDYAQALNNRGNALQELKRHEEALASYDRALAIMPDYADALYDRGNALKELKRHEEALASYDRALAIRPDHADALVNRGNTLQDLRRHEEALASYDRALATKPDYAAALNNRGNALSALSRHEEAIKDLERALGLDPGYDYTAGYLVYSKLHCCVWDTFEAEAARLAADVQAGKRTAVPFALLAVSPSPADQLRCSQIFVRDRYPPSLSPVWRGERYRHDKIRVAYLSADLRDHAVAYLTAGLFELHDRSRFETIAMSFGPDSPGEMRTRLSAGFDRFIDVRQKNDHEVAAMLRDLEVDIAVDLMGFTTDSRTGIFALRPAPVQVNYLGYPGTMGADYIDYIVADRWVIPEEHQRYYTEKVVYLPDTYQVNDSKRRIAERTPSRDELGLPETGFVFCSFNNNYKITPFMFDIWMRLLRRVEGSVLWLLAGNAAVVRNLRREAEKRGVTPERLVFASRVRFEDYLAQYRVAGIFLDNLPYNAGTTASDALWAGLPVVTCAGSAFAGRMAGSLLNAVGLPDLVTRSLEDYEALALKLAKDEKALAEIKSRLTRNRETCPLFDTDRFRRHIEKAYVTVWERYQRGEPPASFAVPM